MSAAMKATVQANNFGVLLSDARSHTNIVTKESDMALDATGLGSQA